MDPIPLLQPAALETFTYFRDLPLELRNYIWFFTARYQSRPRVIQVCFVAETQSWRACKDGCGGLPSIGRVSREARMEALKGYSRVFDTYFDFQYDTVFISDPVFTLRKPREAFLSSDFARNIKHVAITEDIYERLCESHDHFPTLCDRPTTILRKLEGLNSFTMVLSEDDDPGTYQDETGEGDLAFLHAILGLDQEDDLNGGGIVDENETDEWENQESFSEMEEVMTAQDRLLCRLEAVAMANLSRGYFRSVGKIRFGDAMNNPNYEDSWDEWRTELRVGFREEKTKYPEWVRPTFSIMRIEYGLRPIGDDGGPSELHYLGDHQGKLSRPDYDEEEDGEDEDEDENSEGSWVEIDDEDNSDEI